MAAEDARSWLTALEAGLLTCEAHAEGATPEDVLAVMNDAVRASEGPMPRDTRVEERAGGSHRRDGVVCVELEMEMQMCE